MTLDIRIIGPHDEVQRARAHMNQMKGKKQGKGPYPEMNGKGEIVYCIVDPPEDGIRKV